MAPTQVGSTRVSLTPDLSKFGSEARTGLLPIGDQIGRDVGDKISEAIGRRLAFGMPGNMRDAGKVMLPAARRAGSEAADSFADGFKTKLETRLARMKPDVTVRVKLDDAKAQASMKELSKNRIVKVLVGLDDGAAKAKLAALTADRKLKLTIDVDDGAAKAKLARLQAKLDTTLTVEVRDKAAVARLRALTAARTTNIVAGVDDKPAKAKLAALTQARRVTITARLDDKAAKARLDALTRNTTITLAVKLAQGSIQAAEKRIARLGADKTVAIIPKIRESAYKLVERRLNRLTADRVVNINASVDTRVAADELRNLARRRRTIVQADADTGAATTALNHAARNRTALIRVRTIGLPSLTVNSGDGGAGVGMLGGRIAKLAAAATLALPQLASLSSAIAQMGPASAVAAPGLSLLIASFAAIKIGTSGIGDAFKAAFAPADEGAKAAATAARQVENAQRSLENAQRRVADSQRSLKDAQVQAAEQVRQAQQRVGDAERDLTAAQRDASQAQRDLTAARRQAVRDLEDMNQRLAGAELDQRAATLAVQQAEEDLARTRSDPRATQLQIQQAELAADRARQSVEEQRTELQRLKTDTAAANKAGVDGSQAVVAARQQVARADQDVADRQRGLAEAQRDVAKAQADGARRVEDAQRAVADAQRAVADAARSVAEAQEKATAQASKFDQAMAKLSPNARDFVNQVRAMAPAWRALKLDVQDALFAGLGRRLTIVSGQIIPSLKAGLAGTATELNLMGQSALTAVGNLAKAGTLRGTFDTVRSGLSDLRDVPGQFVAALAQMTVAAQPAFERVTTGAASAMDRVMARISAGMASGRLTESINTALDVVVSFGQVIADLFGLIRNVMHAAAAGGGDFFAVIGKALAELRRVTALPEVQATLKSVFTAVQAIASLLATTLGAALRAVLPLLAALAPTVTALAKAFGPVVVQLGKALSTALLPIVKALAPVVAMVGSALKQVVTAVMPLLAPIGRLIAAIVKALAPVLSTVVAVIVQVVKALAGPLTTVVNGLVPVVRLFGRLFAGVFKALLPALKPLIGAVGTLAQIIASVFASALKALLPALAPLIPVVVLVVKLFGELLGAILKPLTPILTLIARIFGQVLGAALKVIAPIIGLIAGVFKELLGAFRPLFPVLGELVGAVGELLKPLLQLLVLALKPLLAVVGFVAKLLVGALGGALKFLVPVVVTVVGWVAKLAAVVAKVVTAIVKAFTWLFDVLLGHSIIPDIVHGAIRWFTNLWNRAVAIFNGLKTAVAAIWNRLWGAIKAAASLGWRILRTGLETFTAAFKGGYTALKNTITSIWGKLWSGIKSAASATWKAIRGGFDAFASGFKSAFRKVKDAVGGIWDQLKSLIKAPIKFWIQVVYNRGIVSVWNKTAAKIPGIPELHTMGLPKGFARGGILSGQSSWRDGDDQLVPMRRGEGVYVSEAMRDPYERARLHAVNQAAMAGKSLKAFRGYAEGGIIGDLGSTVSGILGKGADLVRGGVADLAESAFKPVKAAVNGMAGAKNSGSWPAMIAQAPLNFIDKAIDFIRGKEDEASIGRGVWLKPVNVPYGTKFGVKGHMWSSGRHTGLDFPAKTGTPVRAVAAGRVTSAVSFGPYGPYGKNVQIAHGGDFSSLYAHMSAVLVKAKETVAAGQRIGKVGATGNVTGPHLHLEARMGGRPIDPMPYLQGGGDVGGHGVTRWRGTVVDALHQVNQSVSLVSTVLRRMNQESGGNPTAVNRYDSNWKAGHPSVGLMQVIEGTFRAYAGRYRHKGPFMYGVSVNPLANIYASMRYALSRYGSLAKAYNRPGGYAKGGTARPGELAWVGEQGPELMRVLDDGVRIYPHEQSKRMAAKMGTPVPGYATGGKITVAGKRIDTGPIRASVGGDFLKALAGTAAAIESAMNKVATALKNAFKGVKTTLDDRLIKSVNSYSKKLQGLAGQRDKIRSQISEATALATEQTSAASSFTALTSLPNSGLPFGAGGIAAGLKVRLGQLKVFSKNLGILARRGLAKELLQQIIASGPDSGAPYAAALVAATDAELKDINATQKQIADASKAYGTSAADALYDSGKKAGDGFLTGLKAQEKAITDQMSKLAKAIQKAIKDALKIKSPSRVMAALGSYTVQGFAAGMHAATPQAATTAARMAAVVRSATAAGTARIENNTSSNTYGDRTLNYHATTREVASRQSVLAALAMEDMLHRPVVSGG